MEGQEKDSEEEGQEEDSEREMPVADDSLPFEGATDTAESQAAPLMGGDTISTPVGPLPSLSLLAVAAFIVVFCVAFFALWSLIGGALGIFAGIVVGTALAFAALKLLADRER